VQTNQGVGLFKKRNYYDYSKYRRDISIEGKRPILTSKGIENS
jgi:hypothetical protein